MVQEMQVLRCYSCSTFQVHIVKKAKKWNCKLCNEKQSYKEIYGQGSGKDCRIHAQKLNMLKGMKDEGSLDGGPAALKFMDTSTHTNSSVTTVTTECTSEQTSGLSKIKKWEKYIEKDSTSLQEDDNEEDNRHLLEKTKPQRGKKRKLVNEECAKRPKYNNDFLQQQSKNQTHVETKPYSHETSSTISHSKWSIKNDNWSNKEDNYERIIPTSVHDSKGNKTLNSNPNLAKNKSKQTNAIFKDDNEDKDQYRQQHSKGMFKFNQNLNEHGNDEKINENIGTHHTKQQSTIHNKWSKFLDEEDENTDPDDEQSDNENILNKIQDYKNELVNTISEPECEKFKENDIVTKKNEIKKGCTSISSSTLRTLSNQNCDINNGNNNSTGVFLELSHKNLEHGSTLFKKNINTKLEIKEINNANVKLEVDLKDNDESELFEDDDLFLNILKTNTNLIDSSTNSVS